MQTLPPEPVRMPTAAELEAEARRRKEDREKRQAQLKRGPAVIAKVNTQVILKIRDPWGLHNMSPKHFEASRDFRNEF